jgi:hypothetical protein
VRTIVLADFENRGLAILRLCVARFGQDIDGEPRRTVVYMRTAIIQVLFLSPETGRVPHLCLLNRRGCRNWCLLSAPMRPPILIQPSSPRVKPISARPPSCCPYRTPKVCYRIKGSPDLIRNRRQANARDERVLHDPAGSLIA